MENKESFRARLRPLLSPSDQLDVQLAYCLAKFGHRAQLRKELVEGKPTRYFEHVRRTAIILIDEMKITDRDMIIAALLHDAIEDTDDLTPELIEHSFGLEVVTNVKVLSKVPKEGYNERLKTTPHWKALAIKLCDKLDNLRSLMVPGTDLEFQKKQIKETKEHYYPLFDKLLKICPLNYHDQICVVRDELRKVTERCSLLIELQEEKNAAPQNV